MIAFIDKYRGNHGVEPICKLLPIAPSGIVRRKFLDGHLYVD